MLLLSFFGGIFYPLFMRGGNRVRGGDEGQLGGRTDFRPSRSRLPPTVRRRTKRRGTSPPLLILTSIFTYSVFPQREPLPHIHKPGAKKRHTTTTTVSPTLPHIAHTHINKPEAKGGKDRGGRPNGDDDLGLYVLPAASPPSFRSQIEKRKEGGKEDLFPSGVLYIAEGRNPSSV